MFSVWLQVCREMQISTTAWLHQTSLFAQRSFALHFLSPNHQCKCIPIKFASALFLPRQSCLGFPWRWQSKSANKYTRPTFVHGHTHTCTVSIFKKWFFKGPLDCYRFFLSFPFYSNTVVGFDIEFKGSPEGQLKNP